MAARSAGVNIEDCLSVTATERRELLAFARQADPGDRRIVLQALAFRRLVARTVRSLSSRGASTGRGEGRGNVR
jgi:hypothetical protein